MLNVGAARVDVHLMTWTQIDLDGIGYTRQKTGVPVAIEMATELRQALDAAPRDHVTIINTEFGKPFTIERLQRVHARRDDVGRIADGLQTSRSSKDLGPSSR